MGENIECNLNWKVLTEKEYEKITFFSQVYRYLSYFSHQLCFILQRQTDKSPALLATSDYLTAVDCPSTGAKVQHFTGNELIYR